MAENNKEAQARAAKASANAMARKRAGSSETIDYEQRLRKRRLAILLRILLVIAAAAVIAVVVIIYVERKTYHNFRILQSNEQEDIVSTKYMELDGKILRYSPDGVSLVDSSLDTVWSITHTMQNPVADVRGNRAVVADKDGTTLEIFDKDGMTGNVTVPYAVVKARISSGGLVAAILDSGEDTWINFYASDGSLIAENQTKIDDPGYPMDVAVSNDGLIMMVTFQFVDGGETTSYVSFYNFGDVGQNEDDRIVSGYTYEGIVIPEIHYLTGNRSAAIREDGFVLYEGRQIPKEIKTVSVDKEIVSTFFDDKTIGLVFKNDSKDKLYTMQVYDSTGKLKFRKDFNIPYSDIYMSDGYILMHNSSQMCVINGRGVVKYSGSVDGTINGVIKIGMNRYLLVLDSGINIIKFT